MVPLFDTKTKQEDRDNSQEGKEHLSCGILSPAEGRPRAEELVITAG